MKHDGSPASTPRIELSRREPLTDEPVTIRLTGFAPGQVVQLRARTNGNTGQLWESLSAFKSDSRGVIDLTSQAPESGAYSGVDPMGFIWSMVPIEGQPALRSFPRTIEEPSVIELSAELDGEQVARAELVRLQVARDVKRTPIREGGLVATLFQPPDPEPQPTIVVVGGSGGGIPENMAALFASHGYAALALAYFGAEHLPKELLNIPLEYFATAIQWMQTQSFLDTEHLAVCGTSRGGELALLLGSRHPEIRAVVSYVPSGVVYGAVTQQRGSDETPRPAWTEHGEAIPFLSQVRHELLEAQEDGSIAMTPAYLQALEDTERARLATIPVERINGPVLLISGQKDAMWPSSVFSERIMERLAEYMHTYPDQHLTYEDAGHMLGPPFGPTTISQSYHSVRQAVFDLGGTPAGTAFARADSWPRVLEFLAEHLRTDQSAEVDEAPA